MELSTRMAGPATWQRCPPPPRHDGKFLSPVWRPPSPWGWILLLWVKIHHWNGLGFTAGDFWKILYSVQYSTVQYENQTCLIIFLLGVRLVTLQILKDLGQIHVTLAIRVSGPSFTPVRHLRASLYDKRRTGWSSKIQACLTRPLHNHKMMVLDQTSQWIWGNIFLWKHEVALSDLTKYHI